MLLVAKLRCVTLFFLSVAAMFLLEPATSRANTNSIEVSPGFYYRSWQTDEGLPNNDVHGAVQTPDGFLWVGTGSGLTRFDGHNFVTVLFGGFSNYLRSGIWRMTSFNSGKLLVALETGGLLVRQGEAMEPVTINGESYRRRAYSMCTDTVGRIWTVSLEGEVEQLYAGTSKSLGIPVPGPVRTSVLVTDNEGTVWLASGATLGIFRDNKFFAIATNLPSPLYISPARSSGVWLATALSLCRVEPGGGIVGTAQLPWAAGELNVRDMLEDHAGAVWLGTSSKGLYRWFKGRFQTVATSHNNILCLTEDRAGNLWVGTQGGGLDLVRPRLFKVLDSRRGFPNDSVFSFAEDNAGRVWIATQDRGLAFWSNGVVTVVGPDQGWPRINPFCLEADSKGGIWIGTQNEGLFHWQNGVFSRFSQDRGLPVRLVNCLHMDRSGRLWVGSLLDGLYCLEGDELRSYTVKDGLPDNAVRAVTEDSAGNLWVGTAEGSLVKLVNGRFQTFPHERKEGDSVLAILAADDGALWLGTSGVGLVRFKNGSFQRVSMSAALPDDAIQNLLLDDAGWMWCGGSRGLFRVRLQDLNAYAEGRIRQVQAFSYGASDGLSGFQFDGQFQPAALATRSGQFWFASVKGAVAFWPASFPPSHDPPSVFIEEVRRNGDVEPVADPLILGAGVRTLEFRFTAPEFAAPERVRYRHKLDGKSPEWSPPTSDATVIYTDLTPGEHRFHVMACNADGVWNEQGDSLLVVVAPFFWQLMKMPHF